MNPEFAIELVKTMMFRAVTQDGAATPSTPDSLAKLKQELQAIC